MARSLSKWFNYRDVSTWVFACSVMAFVFIGRAVDDKSHGGFGRSVIYAIVFGFAAWLVSSVIFHWFDRIGSSGTEGQIAADSASFGQRMMDAGYWTMKRVPTTFIDSLKTHGLVWLICTIICWLPWLVVC